MVKNMLKFIQAILIKVVFYLDFDYATIGKHIQQYRFELDKTQEGIAEKANISKNYLSKIETGKSAGRLDKYYSIAKALGVTIDMLIDNTSNRASSDNQLFYNQLLSLISSLSLNQRKMLIEFIELLRNHNGECL